tara:strand:- start:613 stop:2193 length:1581 start_codon:yes stop_codon:yes gene_type:complete
MFSEEILDTLKVYTKDMKCDVRLIVQNGDHDKREELLNFLGDVASASRRISVAEQDLKLTSPISFVLEADGTNTGIQFSGIPSGHEFNSLVLAILQSSGTAIKLDQGLQALVKNIADELCFEVFVSLSCHNCPDVVQALNQFALLNPNISVNTIDGGLFQDLITDRGIQGVPSIFVNGGRFADGKVDAASLIDKLIELNPGASAVPVESSLPVQDIALIGAGPAGVSAAIYAARKGLKVTIVSERFGGQVKDTLGIENFISVNKTTGPQMTDDLMEHLKAYEITLKENLRVEKLEPGEMKTLILSSGEQIKARAVIVATGARWRELDVPGEKENLGSGVAYCPHCDGPFFKGKKVAVIGGGNSGIEAALDLAGIVESVTVFEFLPELNADQILIDKAEARENISIVKNAATKEITSSSGKVDGLLYEDRSDGSEHRCEISGVFVQIGLVPNSQFLDGVLELTAWGEIKIDEKCRTSSKGIFACGDVTTVPYKQIVVAMGEGSKASLSAFEYLLMNETKNDGELAAA